MKKGYVVKNSVTRVELIEVEILGTVTYDDDEKTSTVITCRGKVLWSSHPQQQPASNFNWLHIGNYGTFHTYDNGKFIRDDVITDLVKAKQIAQDLLAKEIKILEKRVQGYQISLQDLKQPVDWGTFPKDEYISPFTGKKA